VAAHVDAVRGEHLGGRALPPLEAEVLAPAVEPPAVAPDRLDDLGDATIAARQQSLHDAGATVVVPEADRPAVALVGLHRLAQLAQALVGGLPVQLGGPLERRVRLGHEPADRDGAPDVLATGHLAPGVDDPLGEL